MSVRLLKYLVFSEELIFLIENFFISYRQNLETVFDDKHVFFNSKTVSTWLEFNFFDDNHLRRRYFASVDT